MFRRITAYVGPDSNPTFDSWRPGWKKGFSILELVINRKFHQEVVDSRVGRREAQSYLHYKAHITLFRLSSFDFQGIKSLPRTDYDIAALRLDYPIIDEISGMTLLKVRVSKCHTFTVLQEAKFTFCKILIF